MTKTVLIAVLAGMLPLSLVSAAEPARYEWSFTTSNGWTVSAERQMMAKDFFDGAGQTHYQRKIVTKAWLYDAEGNLRDRKTIVDQDNYLGVYEPTRDYFWLFRTWTHKFNYVLIVDYDKGEIVVTEVHLKFHDWQLQFCNADETICELECNYFPWACNPESQQILVLSDDASGVCDDDGDVDADDTGTFEQCASRSGIEQAAGCEDEDNEGEGDSDDGLLP